MDNVLKECFPVLLLIVAHIPQILGSNKCPLEMPNEDRTKVSAVVDAPIIELFEPISC